MAGKAETNAARKWHCPSVGGSSRSMGKKSPRLPRSRSFAIGLVFRPRSISPRRGSRLPSLGHHG
jgi:hypothetical protein